jgi:hypothetical protein
MRRMSMVLLGGFLMLSASLTFGETLACTPVSSVPTTLSTAGIYCLLGPLATGITSGAAITIAADNVVLDLNGWRLAGETAGSGTKATGIYSTARNVTVQNGTVTGFYDGVDLRGAGARAEGLLLDRNTYYGMLVAGRGALVRANRVTATGGSTVAANRAAIGIAVRGPGALIDDNFISGLTGTGTGGEFGIYVVYADNVAIRNNVVTDDARPTPAGRSSGIWVENSASASIVAATVTNFQHGVEYHNSSGIYSRSVMIGCDTPYYGGTAGSDND